MLVIELRTPCCTPSCFFCYYGLLRFLACFFLRFCFARFVSKTLLAAQIQEEGVRQASDSAMEFLFKHNFVVASASGSGRAVEGDSDGDYGVASTQLGQARILRSNRSILM